MARFRLSTRLSVAYSNTYMECIILVFGYLVNLVVQDGRPSHHTELSTHFAGLTYRYS